jgi:hypothetical protein
MGKILREFWPSWAAVTVFTFLVAVFVVRSQPNPDPCPVTWEELVAGNNESIANGNPPASREGMEKFRSYYCQMRELRDQLARVPSVDREREYLYKLWEVDYIRDQQGLVWRYDFREPTTEQANIWFDILTVAEYLQVEHFGSARPVCVSGDTRTDCEAKAVTPFGELKLTWAIGEEFANMQVKGELFGFSRVCHTFPPGDTLEELFECSLMNVHYTFGANQQDCENIFWVYMDLGYIDWGHHREGKTCVPHQEVLPPNIDQIIAASTQ